VVLAAMALRGIIAACGTRDGGNNRPERCSSASLPAAHWREWRTEWQWFARYYDIGGAWPRCGLQDRNKQIRVVCTHSRCGPGGHAAVRCRAAYASASPKPSGGRGRGMTPAAKVKGRNE
jgi:hypothetical protein